MLPVELCSSLLLSEPLFHCSYNNINYMWYAIILLLNVLLYRYECIILKLNVFFFRAGVEEGIDWLVECIKRNSDVRPSHNHEDS